MLCSSRAVFRGCRDAEMSDSGESSQAKPGQIRYTQQTIQSVPEARGMSDLIGQTIRGYQVLEKIGEGGYGVVYKAHQPDIERDVAIKVILPEHASKPEFQQRFSNEARLVARLEHPHIIPLY